MPTKIVALAAALVGLGPACTRSSAAPEAGHPAESASRRGGLERAIFAGGCFWCMQPPFDEIAGVVSTSVGYCGGQQRAPSYAQVARGETGHAESLEVVYDPSRVTYRRLLEVFWRNIDPTDGGGQFVDRGAQYRPAIFYLDDRQRRAALASRARLAQSRRFAEPLAVQVVKAGRFWPAESYHQQFYKKNPGRYYRYRSGSGRDAFLRRTWRRAPSGTVQIPPPRS
jgi:methionine-S-sulfoxide reductase